MTDRPRNAAGADVRARRDAALLLGRQHNWPELVKALIDLGSGDQPAANTYTLQAFWLAVHTPVDVDTLVVLGAQLVARLGAEHEAAPLIALTSAYLNHRRGVGHPLQETLHGMARQMLDLCIAAREADASAFLAWVKGERLSDPDHLLPALDAALDALVGEQGWLFDRAAVSS